MPILHESHCDQGMAHKPYGTSREFSHFISTQPDQKTVKLHQRDFWTLILIFWTQRVSTLMLWVKLKLHCRVPGMNIWWPDIDSLCIPKLTNINMNSPYLYQTICFGGFWDYHSFETIVKAFSVPIQSELRPTFAVCSECCRVLAIGTAIPGFSYIE